jgi:hypothetical protein
MPILGIVASQITGHLASPTSFDSIQTVTLGSAQTTISFTSIPSTYKHLQIRMINRTDRGGGNTEDLVQIRFNSDTTANYAYHILEGTGTVANTAGVASSANPWNMFTAAAGATASVFAAAVADVLDYTNTNKYKTTRTLQGLESNTVDSRGGITSSLWMNTGAITRIDISPVYGTNFVQYSHAALYGVKG